MTSKLESLADRHLSRLLPVLLCLLVAMVTLQPAHAARQALVIGNAAYTEGALKNPVNDARAMDAKLTALGFKVMKVENLKRQQIGRTLTSFANGLKPGDEVVVFYAGHGVQVKGINYLPAVDADIQSEEDVALNSLNLNSLMERLDEAKAGLKLLFLDACRNNPYARSMRSGDRGLARISAAPSGTLIHFATRPGSIAADGSGSNGLYTTQLLRFIDSADVPVEAMLKRVSAAVTEASKRQQEPWTEGSIVGEFYFKPGALATTSKPEPMAASPRPGQVAGLSLADLEREESTRKAWTAWQAKMKADFDKTAQFTGSADLRIKAWERFLAAWAQDNPQSQEDERLREQAQNRLAGARQATLKVVRQLAESDNVVAVQGNAFAPNALGNLSANGASGLKTDGAIEPKLRFVLQVGAFADDKAAQEVLAKLERIGVKTYTQAAETADGPRVRIRVGPFSSRDEADKAAARLRAAGLSSSVLKL